MPKKFKQKTRRFGPYGLTVGGSDDKPALYIYGDIGDSWWSDESTSATQMVEALDDIDADEIDVFINSYGGSVKDGLAIFNALQRHDAEITVHIDGVAASMASYIAMAGDVVNIAENGMLMIHAPWSYAVGNAAEMREAADVLDRYAESMVAGYARGLEKDEARDLLTDGKDHWYSAEEAREAGLADEVTDEVDAEACIAPDRFNKFPAAAAAFIQPSKKVKNMKRKTSSKKAKQAAVKTKPVASSVDENAIAEQALAQDSVRIDAIEQAFQPFMSVDGMDALLKTCSKDKKCTVDMAREKAMAKLGEGVESVGGPRVETGESEQEKLVTGVTQALSVRAGLIARGDDGFDMQGNEFRSYSLREVARAFLERHNIATGMMDPLQMVGAAFAHSTDDFGNLLANIANKAMLKGYDEAEETFQLWTNDGELGDFKISTRTDLDMFPSLASKPEGAEYKYATIGDRGEQVQLATYGRMFKITREAIINDDLRAFTQIPRKMGRAAIRTVGDLVYAVLTSNPNMADGTALFHADHGNLKSGASMTTEFLDELQVAMATQKQGDANLNIRMANLLVPVALQGAAKTLRDSKTEVVVDDTKPGKVNVPNSVRGTFEVISDARLDAASATTFYSAASATMHDTVEVSYLNGNKMPFLDQQDAWTTDGSEFKVRIDAGVKALDFKTMQKATA